MEILPFIDIVEDLNRDLTASQRYQRMLDILHRSHTECGTPCDAIALLKLEGDELRAEHHHQIAQRLIANDLSHEIIGRSPALQATLTKIHTVAPTDLSVLVSGETGVGTELVQINCAAHFPEPRRIAVVASSW
jgi:transcriptional regulator with GAF, ATPase, and Fis domain